MWRRAHWVLGLGAVQTGLVVLIVKSSRPMFVGGVRYSIDNRYDDTPCESNDRKEKTEPSEDVEARRSSVVDVSAHVEARLAKS